MAARLCLRYDRKRKKFEVDVEEKPDPDEVKRLWKQGKSLGAIKEELKKKGGKCE